VKVLGHPARVPFVVSNRRADERDKMGRHTAKHSSCHASRRDVLGIHRAGELGNASRAETCAGFGQPPTRDPKVQCAAASWPVDSIPLSGIKDGGLRCAPKCASKPSVSTPPIYSTARRSRRSLPSMTVPTSGLPMDTTRSKRGGKIGHETILAEIRARTGREPLAG
jgi:hypothetical protein